MTFIGVIQEYIADINFAVLSYNVYYIFTKQDEKTDSSTKDSHTRRKIIIKYLDRLGDIIAEIEVLGETSIFRVATRDLLTDNPLVTLKQRNDTAVSSLDTGPIEKVVLASNAKGFKSRIHKKHQQQQSLLTPTTLKILRWSGFESTD